MTKNFDLVAEQSVLGAVLIDPSCVAKVLTAVGPDDFSPQNKPWVLCIADMFSAGQRIDAVTLLAAMRTTCPSADPDVDSQRRQYILQIVDITPTSANVDAYLRIVQERSRMRKVHQFASEILASPTEDGVPVLADKLSATLAAIPRKDGENLLDGWMKLFNRIESGEEPDYLQTGLSKLDKAVHIRPGNFVILGGYSSDGKTALALQMALEISKSKRVGFFSLETDNDTLMQRIASNVSGVDFGDILNNKLTQTQINAVVAAMSQTSNCTLERIQASGYSVADIRHRTQRDKLEVIFVDYLQIVSPDNPREGQYRIISDISKGLHNLAQQLGVTVFALSQFNRTKDGSGRTSPTLDNLRDSGQLEHDADVIFLLSAAELTPKERSAGLTLPKGAYLRRLNIAKNKNGGRNKLLYLWFWGNKQKFEQPVLVGEVPPGPPEYQPKQELIELPTEGENPFEPSRKNRGGR
jgi:replicative DNA helicase